MGWVAFDRDLEPARRGVQAMVDSVAARGPDSEGVWIRGSAALGHRRLAVIDIAGGQQPMSVDTSSGPVALTFSGEIYNFRELRTELESAGHRFRTASDTEVVLQGWLAWGDDLPRRLNGMFAMAIWDARVDALVLVRDRLGIKPLYFSPTRDGVLFGSEPKAILASGQAPRIVDADGLRRLLAYSLTLPGVPWAGMREVTPGGIVTVDRAGIHETTYWTLSTHEHRDGREETVRHVRALLEDVVARQLVADVPIGLLLSGGLDSSTLAVLAATRLGADGRRLRTYSVDFPGHAERFVPDAERADPDGPYVELVRERLGTDHRSIVVDDRDLADPDVRRAAVAAYDLPPGSGDRDRSMYLLFRAIRAQSTVVLSGESADELFGGYGWFHDPVVQQTPMFPWVTACRPTYGMAPGSLRPDVDALLDFDHHLESQYRAAASEVEHLDGAPEHERRMREVCHLHLTRQLRVLLDRKDRLSMASGLEVRVPYCDHRLVEYVYNVPWSMKRFDGREKSVLRAAMADALPAGVLRRKKSAYPSIQDPKFVEAMQREAHELLTDPSHAAFEVIDHGWLQRAAREDPVAIAAATRNTLEWTLNFSSWLEGSRPQLRLR